MFLSGFGFRFIVSRMFLIGLKVVLAMTEDSTVQVDIFLLFVSVEYFGGSMLEDFRICFCSSVSVD